MPSDALYSNKNEIRYEKDFFVLLFALVAACATRGATEVDIDSLRYTLNSDGTATVSECLYMSTPDINIPSTVSDGTQNYTVTKIGNAHGISFNAHGISFNAHGISFDTVAFNFIFSSESYTNL